MMPSVTVHAAHHVFTSPFNTVGLPCSPPDDSLTCSKVVTGFWQKARDFSFYDGKGERPKFHVRLGVWPSASAAKVPPIS
jgi:hypothetical protein